MQHIVFDQSPTYKVGLLIKTAAFDKSKLEGAYINELVSQGIEAKDIIAFDLDYGTSKKPPMKVIEPCLASRLKALDSLGVTTLFVCDSNYFKKVTGVGKVDPHYGYVLPCKLKGFKHMNAILAPNFQGAFYNPIGVGEKMKMALSTLVDEMNGVYAPPGLSIIHSEYYPSSLADVKAALDGLLNYPMLTCDIEGFSLSFNEAGIATMGFAWDQHNGIAIPCDYRAFALGSKNEEGHYGEQIDNNEIKVLFMDFFENYKGKLMYHNSNYDIKVLVYELWMHDMLDQKNLIAGIKLMHKGIEDTKLIAYLATNSCAGNTLGLKALAHEFAGNYAQDDEDIKDVRRIPLPDLLRYNLVDCLSTWYVYNKHYKGMVADKQLSIYEDIMIPSVRTILQMELTGMPMEKARVEKTQKEMQALVDVHMKALDSNVLLQNFMVLKRAEACKIKNEELVKKVKPLSDWDDMQFNPASNQQLGDFLHLFLKIPIIDLTPTKQPAVGAKTLKKLLANTTNPAHKEVLGHVIGLAEVAKILNDFITNFLNRGIMKADGKLYLHGNFNLGGTVSGRLSSSGPNMQNIPSTKSKYAKPVKRCFSPPEGWLMMGADFASLEDRISALTTKDPNKLKVYTDGYDGHCLRAFSYWPEKLPGIVDTVESINSIKSLFPKIRQASKEPTFLLTYQGTYHGLMHNVGLSKAVAQAVEKNYHTMYRHSDEWIAERLQLATVDGYVTVAFGLRLRTPILGKTLLGTRSTPFEAKAESRTAGNAMGQSYGLLNNRAAIEFQEKVFNSPFALDIKPIAQIHDAMYFLVRDRIDVVEWFNIELVKCMEWCGLPEIQHPIVKLGGDVEIFHPSWADPIGLPNNASRREIMEVCREAVAA